MDIQWNILKLHHQFLLSISINSIRNGQLLSYSCFSFVNGDHLNSSLSSSCLHLVQKTAENLILQNIFNSDEISDYLDNSLLDSVEKIVLTPNRWTINKLEGDLVYLRQIQIQRKSYTWVIFNLSRREQLSNI